MIGVSICTAALVVVLSVFNGLEGLLFSLYSTFDPEIKVEAATGKTFVYNDALKQKISAIQGVDIITDVIEDYAYVKYKDADKVITLKGVNENFLKQERINDNIVEGELKLKKSEVNYAIVGRGIQYALSFSTKEDFHALQLFYIKNPKAGSVDPSKLYSKQNILPGSVFAIEQHYDDNYIIVPVEFASTLLNYGKKRTSLEIKTSSGNSIKDVIGDLKEILGKNFLVQDRHQQQADLYKLLNLEKLFVFLVFSFILAVGSINIFFSLSMLALDKKKDVAVLYAMGASDITVKGIFLSEGAIISIGGAILGSILGASICLIQQKYGLIGMGTQSTVISSYPIQMQLSDFVYTALSITAITFAASYRPAVIATRYNKANLL